MSLFRQIEQGAHYIRIYSTRKVFLEHVVVELVYKFDEKSTARYHYLTLLKTYRVNTYSTEKFVFKSQNEDTLLSLRPTVG